MLLAGLMVLSTFSCAVRIVCVLTCNHAPTNRTEDARPFQIPQADEVWNVGEGANLGGVHGGFERVQEVVKGAEGGIRAPLAPPQRAHRLRECRHYHPSS
jgi:hypothetical protein